PKPGMLSYYQALQQELLEERIKWVEPHNMHVTLWFFGEVKEHLIIDINRQLNKAAEGTGPFSMGIRGCGTFGKGRNPTVIWFGLDVPEAMKFLHERITDSLGEIGILGEDREFNPHLTLGRIREVNHPEKMKAILKTMEKLDFQVAVVSSFSLYESKLRPEGPLYIELKKFNLVL
ncbi:MAG: RNA 2',3'-cyclic phosphodiesterase, partial [Bacteroidetes bacterium]|nr:RNA 2',3'-cyclic phosphodiesterase [Bacteroidota bacterium]